MRIAYIVTGGFDQSGQEHVIPTLLTLVERQARRHDVTVYVLRYHPAPRSYRLRGAIVHDLGRPPGTWRQYSALVRAMRRDGPFDVAHAYWALPAGLAGGLAAARLRTPFVVTYDSGEFAALPDIAYGLQRTIRQRIAVRLTERLAVATTVCTTFMQRLAQSHGSNPDVIPLGVDAAFFQAPEHRPAGPPWRLLHVASLNPVKDQTTLLRAFANLHRLMPDVHLDIVGEDTLGGRITQLAQALGIERAVTFHGFRRSRELVAMYQRSHLLVLSSRHEAAGAVVLEAAACGLPTVGTAVGYVSDLMPDRALGVPVQDAENLTRRIAEVLANPSRLTHMGEAARQWARQHDADWTARQFDLLYHRLAHPNAGRRARAAATQPPPR